MAAKSKANTKKDLETKIAALEAKINQLSTQLVASKPAESPAAEKPAKAKPAEKPAKAKPAEERPVAETTKPKGVLPKGTVEKQTLVSKPDETSTTKPKDVLPKGMAEKQTLVSKPAETTSQPPTTVQDALENAYMTAPMTSFHDYRAKVTGYSPAPNRYFVRSTAPVGKVPTKNWNDQKAVVTGYTASSNQYYATRARLAYHPADKTFGSFSGVNMTVDGIDALVQQAPEPATTPEPPKPNKGTLPKGMGKTPPPPQQSTQVADDGKSRGKKLADYEADYLQRIDQQRIDDEKTLQELLKAEEKAKAGSTTSKGTLPKGFEPKPKSEPKPEAPKTSKGTLPKGF